MQSRKARIEALMEGDRLDGVIASSPENFHYLTGTASHQHAVSRQASFASAALGADGSLAAVVMDFEAPALGERRPGLDVRAYDTWVGVREASDIEPNAPARPGESGRTMRSSLDVLAETLEAFGLADGRLGLELDFLPGTYVRALSERLPKAAFVNASSTFQLARSVKTPEELSLFKTLAGIGDEALRLAGGSVRPGMRERDVARAYREAVVSAGPEPFSVAPSAWSTFNTGPNSSRLSLPSDRVIASGDVFKFDGGVNAEFDFYTTDFSRSWIVGEGDPRLMALKARLYSALCLMKEAIRPGLGFAELFALGFDHVQSRYPAYRRGHLGHSISMGPQTAEAPFISRTETRRLEAGMVLCVEVPCYVRGIGGFNLEDMVVVTEGGCDVLTDKAPHYLPGEAMA